MAWLCALTSIFMKCNPLQLELSGNFCIQFGKLSYHQYSVFTSGKYGGISNRGWLMISDGVRIMMMMMIMMMKMIMTMRSMMMMMISSGLILVAWCPTGAKYEGTWHEVSCRIARRWWWWWYWWLTIMIDDYDWCKWWWGWSQLPNCISQNPSTVFLSTLSNLNCQI